MRKSGSPSLQKRAQAPHLPPELLGRILSLPITDADRSGRYTILRSSSLVCRDWRGPSQRELFRFVVLPGVKELGRFARILRGDIEGDMSGWVRLLEMNGADAAGGDREKVVKQVRDLCRKCSKLQSLRLRWLEDVRLEEIAISQSES